MSWRLVRTVAESVLVPVAAYFALLWAGLPQVWALAASAATSLAGLVVGWLRSRTVSTLGFLVLVQFLLGIAVAAVTLDARAVLAKDYAIGLIIVVIAAASLASRRPLIARIRRELVADPKRFDALWAADGDYRALHRRLTWLWVVGLAADAVVGILLIYTLELNLAVVVTNTVGTSVRLALIAVTQRRAAGYERRIRTPPPRQAATQAQGSPSRRPAADGKG